MSIFYDASILTHPNKHTFLTTCIVAVHRCFHQPASQMRMNYDIKNDRYFFFTHVSEDSPRDPNGESDRPLIQGLQLLTQVTHIALKLMIVTA